MVGRVQKNGLTVCCSIVRNCQVSRKGLFERKWTHVLYYVMVPRSLMTTIVLTCQFVSCRIYIDYDTEVVLFMCSLFPEKGGRQRKVVNSRNAFRERFQDQYWDLFT
jgi:hypothetical protein